MSHETRPSVTKAENPLVDDEQEVDAHEKPKNRSRRAFLIGAGSTAAALALAGGLFIGLKGDSEKTEPRAEPGTSAPASPGQQTPSAAETAPATPELNQQNFPFVLNGETLSFEDFLDKAEVTREEYPTPEAAIKAYFEEGVTGWINAGNTKEEYAKYNGSYITPDGETYGLPGTAKWFYTPAYQEALIGAGDYLSDNLPGQDPERFSLDQAELHRQNAAFYAQTQDEAHPFRAEYELINNPKLDNPDVHIFVDDKENPDKLSVASFTVVLRYSDNGDQNSIGERRSEAGGYQGVTEPKVDQLYKMQGGLAEVDGVWKIIAGELEEITPQDVEDLEIR